MSISTGDAATAGGNDSDGSGFDDDSDSSDSEVTVKKLIRTYNATVKV